MSRHGEMGVRTLVLLAVLAELGLPSRSPAGEKSRPAAAEAKQDSPDVAAVRKTTQEFVKAFNRGDAKALAAFWTKDGEYIDPDGEALRGRDAIEKTYVEFFKNNPKASLEGKVESVRLYGRNTAVEEGVLKLRLEGDKEPGESRFSVLHVRENDGWRMASVREWVPDPQELVSLKDLEWIVGEWSARSEDTELNVAYAWDEDHAFLRCRYTLKKEGKVVSSGTQIIGNNPAGGLRAWLFDSSGAFGELSWSRDEGRWVIEATGTLPDGSEIKAESLIVPLNQDAFTWQSTGRTAGASALPEVPPVKVTRVKADK